jgi:hypothetical protein
MYAFLLSPRDYYLVHPQLWQTPLHTEDHVCETLGGSLPADCGHRNRALNPRLLSFCLTVTIVR